MSVEPSRLLQLKFSVSPLVNKFHMYDQANEYSPDPPLIEQLFHIPLLSDLHIIRLKHIFRSQSYLPSFASSEFSLPMKSSPIHLIFAVRVYLSYQIADLTH